VAEIGATVFVKMPVGLEVAATTSGAAPAAGAYFVATRSVPARLTEPSTASASPSLALRRSSASVPPVPCE